MLKVINHLSVQVELLVSKETSILKPLAILEPEIPFPFPLEAVLKNEQFSLLPHGFG